MSPPASDDGISRTQEIAVCIVLVVIAVGLLASIADVMGYGSCPDGYARVGHMTVHTLATKPDAFDVLMRDGTECKR